MAEGEGNRAAHRLNAMHPNQFELLLSLEGPGAPESLDEAVRRVETGKPVVRGSEPKEGE